VIGRRLRKDPRWREAMLEEMTTLEKNNYLGTYFHPSRKEYCGV
jgi:hypothetical protein